MKSAVRVASIVAAVAASGFLASPPRADVQRIAPDGTVYRVDIELVPTPGKPGASLLRWTLQRAGGGKDLSVVAGTDDTAAERDPALEIDPATGTPVVVWSRYDTGGFNLYVSRLDTVWSAPRQIVKLDGDDIEPQIHLTRRYLHVSWRQRTGSFSTYWRASFYSGSYQLAYGPERIPTDDLDAIPLEGGPETDGDVSSDDRYFCATVLGRTLSDPVQAYVWGVRDEPVPIGYLQSFVLPPQARTVVAQRAEYAGGRLTLWVATADAVYYTTLANGRWADMRVVELGPKTSLSDVRLLLEESNRRLSSP